MSAEPSEDPSSSNSTEQEERPPLWPRIRRVLFGAPRRLTDRKLFHRLSLIPFLAWVGLGADGLSSSAYGPEEAYRTLGEHVYLALALAVAMAGTVFIISAAYSRIIEQFPHGGGGYLVATKLLGEQAGVVSGSALLVDYILTITISIAAAGDALFSFIPIDYHFFKLPCEFIFIIGLMTLNIRGVRESVLTLAPVFLLFIATHVILIIGGIVVHAPQLAATFESAASGYSQGLTTLGVGGLLLLLVHAYSLGGGTYTGIEAVSNGLPIMREPRVWTAKRTMLYMSCSLAFTATGLLLCYLLWKVEHVEGKTLNAVLAERFAGGSPAGQVFVLLSLLSEGALLIVAAQAGFLDGPRVLANMAVDSWVPHRFSALSDRLTTQNGISLMGFSSLAALLYTKGDVRHLVVMYSINVFLTFSLSMLGMLIHLVQDKEQAKNRKGRLVLFFSGFLLCVTILAITIFEKFAEGGWITLLITGFLIVFCFAIRRHYRQVGQMLRKLYSILEELPAEAPGERPAMDPRKPTAAVLVASYSGLGIHTFLNAFKTFPNHYHNLVFLSVGVIDSGGFKGEKSIEHLRKQTRESLDKYLELARRLGIPATSRMAIGTDAVEEAEKLCLEAARDFPNITYFAGNVIFQREKWYYGLLHNGTAFAIQKRLQWAGRTMVILPVKVR